MSGPRDIRPEVIADPRAALDALGAVWSPDFDAYAAGQLDVSQVRCVLCRVAPCECRQCEAPYLRFGATEPEPCGMTIGQPGVSAPNECPRGHVTPEPAEACPLCVVGQPCICRCHFAPADGEPEHDAAAPELPGGQS